ncbi:MAG: enoyl-CoA hydratase/isomerase family protein [Pseudonocardiales bacterium]|nr:enoyl-CoA hydratase/isomerase family protein [Pseudonocardiales bacterium]
MTLADPDLLQRGGLTVDVDGARATITLSRPDALNAQTPATWHALAAVGEDLPADVRVVVVRGQGRAFSAGLDRSLFVPTPDEPGIAGLAGLPAEDADALIAGYQAGFTWLRDPARVTVAAVQGHAIGAGFQLALACDLRVVAEDVQFCMAETGLGIVPDLGGTLPLVQAVGYARAVDICLTGRRVGAAEAVAAGLAQRSVPRDGLDAAVDELVTALLAPPPRATAETLALLAAAAEGADPAAQLGAERSAQLRRLRSLAAGEG